MQPSQMPQNNNLYTPSRPVFTQAPEDYSVEGHDVVEWEASEYVQHAKGPAWFIVVGVVTVVAMGVALFFQQWLLVVLLAVMGVTFAIFGMRKPRVIRYRLSDDGLVIGDKTYRLTDFRAFGVREDGAFYTVMLIPVKRLAPGLNIYFSEDEGERILDILGDHLPMEPMQTDPIDLLMSKLRF